MTSDGATPAPGFASLARDGEDVVIWRALGHLDQGRAIGIGAWQDEEFSPLRALEQHGWMLLDAGDARSADALAGEWAQRDVHVLALGPDVAADEAVARLAGVGVYPWVIIAASAADAAAGTRPDPPTAPDYRHCLYDGVNDYLVRAEHSELVARLGYPRCSRDRSTSPLERRLRAQLDELGARLDRVTQEAQSWREAAVRNWESTARGISWREEISEAEAMRNTISWRITRPLRAVRGRMSPSARLDA